MAWKQYWLTVDATSETINLNARNLLECTRFAITIHRSGDIGAGESIRLIRSDGTAVSQRDYDVWFRDKDGNVLDYQGSNKDFYLAAGVAEKTVYIYTLTNGDIYSNWTKYFTVRLPEDATVVAGAGSLNLSVVNNITSTPTPAINHAPTVVAPFPRVAAAALEYFSYKIPGDVFTDADGDRLTYSATLKGVTTISSDGYSSTVNYADGTPLPWWLGFNASTGTFTGIYDGALTAYYTIRVTANDGRGGTASTDLFVDGTVKTTPVKTTGPVLVGKSPQNTASPDTTITLTFDRNVKAGAGYITLTNLNNSGTRRIYLNAAENSQLNQRVVFDGKTVTIHAGADLTPGSSIGVTYDSGVILGTDSVSADPLTAGTFNFSTAAAFFHMPLSDKDTFSLKELHTSNEYRKSEFSPTGHLGEDWNRGSGNEDKGDIVYSIFSGKIEVSNYSAGWGNYVVIRHDMDKIIINGTAYDHVYSLYGHLNEKSAVQDATVQAGQKIGTVGDTGNSIGGAHLHFQMATDLKAITAQSTAYDSSNYKNSVADGDDLCKISSQYTGTGVDIYYFDPSRFINEYNSGIRIFAGGAKTPEVTTPLEGVYMVAPPPFNAATAFDAYEYLASNQDLIKAFGNNPTAATQHYNTYGKNEGRSTNSFNPYSYLAGNADVYAVAGNSVAKAQQHYISYGQKEGRSATSFNPLQYLAGNRDLAAAFGADQSAALDHYMRYGKNEGRSVAGFDPNAYKSKYADIAAAFGADLNAAINHYLVYGRNEGRSVAAASDDPPSLIAAASATDSLTDRKTPAFLGVGQT